MLGNHLDRKRSLAPLTYAFVDFEGTRSNTFAADILKSEFPHIHAVMLAPPQLFTFLTPTLPAPNSFFWAIGNPAVRWLPSIRDPQSDFQVLRFNPEIGTLDNLVSYCMKG